MENEFYVFGSKTSYDYDCFVKVDKIPNIQQSHKLCKYFNDKISTFDVTKKPINSNLCIIKDGIIIDTFKGTPDECNNSLYYTFRLHNQTYFKPVHKVLERDIPLKFKRTMRIILSFFSKTELRPIIKHALKNSAKDKYNALKEIDFNKMVNFPKKNDSKKDIYKIMAFQFGQCFSLIDGYEPYSYTKEGLIEKYPDFKNHLNRKDLNEKDLVVLNNSLKRFLKLSEKELKF